MFTYDGSYPYLEEVNEGILRHIAPGGPGAGSTVLDVGCGQGSLGAEIAALGHEVWGIEQAAFAAGRAEERLSCLVECDLTDEAAVRKSLGGQHFDTIVFSDVLEHVYDPLSVLRSYLEYLEPGGRILISLPNVANWQTRLALLAGRFDYQDSGVHDRTHIRFFTYKTATEMVHRAGLQVDTVDSTPFIARALLPLAKRLLSRRGQGQAAPDPRAIIDSSAYRFYMRYLYPFEYRVGSLRKPLLAFRIILVASRSR